MMTTLVPNRTLSASTRVLEAPRRTIWAHHAGSGDVVDVISRPVDLAHSALPQDVLSEEEIILMWLKPSLWYILLASIGSLLVIAFLTVLLAYLATLTLPLVAWTEREAFAFGALVAIVRLAWQALDWWNQIYVLTDRRVIAVNGVFRRVCYQAPLGHLQHIAVIQRLRERFFGLGSIAFATAGSDRYDAVWLTIARPFAVYRQINRFVDRYTGRHT